MLAARIVDVISRVSCQCEPLTLTRTLGQCPLANRPLRVHQEEVLAAAVAKKNEGAADGDDRALTMRSDAWVSPESVEQLLAAESLPAAVVNEQGVSLAWLAERDQACPPAAAVSLPCDTHSFIIQYPWDLLRLNEYLVTQMTADDIRGDVSPKAEIDGCLSLGANSQILPGVYVEGKVIIGRDCKIGPNCYLRGNTAIGNGCRVGQAVEVKNSILMPGATIAHLSYCGDSVIGENVNFGAGTIVANLRHDGATHRSMVAGELVDTKRRKMGAIIADGVHTGIHTSIYPARKIWPHKMTRPGDIVKKDIQ